MRRRYAMVCIGMHGSNGQNVSLCIYGALLCSTLAEGREQDLLGYATLAVLLLFKLLVGP